MMMQRLKGVVLLVVCTLCLVDGYRHSLRSSTKRRTVLRPGMEDDFGGPRFRRSEKSEIRQTKKAGADMNTINAKLLAEIEEAKSSVRIEAPQVETRDNIDISDINPSLYAFSALLTEIAAYFLFQFSIFVAGQFADHPFSSDFYPVERFANFLRQALIAGISLLTGLTALTGIGLFLLAASVALANLKGEAPSAFPLDNVFPSSADADASGPAE